MKGYEYLKNFLREEGFRFNEEESYISFKFEGNTFVAFKKETSFLSILQICNANGSSRSQLLEKCNDLNDQYFIVKFTVHDDKVWCTYEFMPSSQTTSDDFITILTLLDKASDDLLNEISK